MSIAHSDLLKLSVSEKLQLIGELWDSIDDADQIPLTAGQVEELERRMEEFRRHRESASPGMT